VDFVSITLLRDQALRTVAATEPVAEQMDALQYELREGPCYAAVTCDRFVLVNDLTSTSKFPRYAARAADAGVGSQAAIQLVHNGETAGLNLYARKVEAFDRSTIQMAELFATQAAALLQYATQVEHLSEALHSRTDIGMAVGIIMERYSIDRERAFAFLVRGSSTRNIKLRLLAQKIVEGTLATTPQEDAGSQEWP
jgi:GAF domain-containing protein